MPMHEWTCVDAGIFHGFHHRWISSITDVLNTGLLPEDYYALPEQIAAGFWPDVLTLQERGPKGRGELDAGAVSTPIALQTRPQTRFVAATNAEFYRRKKSSIVIRHVSDDRIIAMIEIVSPGNKAGRIPFQAFVDKVCELLERRIHLLIIDPFPPGPRDPNGIHAAIWESVEDQSFQLPPDKPLTLVAYECELSTRAYVEPVAVGDILPDMPIFLEPDGCIKLPLETTYQTAFSFMPARWKRVLEGASAS